MKMRRRHLVADHREEHGLSLERGRARASRAREGGAARTDQAKLSTQSSGVGGRGRSAPVGTPRRLEAVQPGGSARLPQQTQARRGSPPPGENGEAPTEGAEPGARTVSDTQACGPPTTAGGAGGGRQPPPGPWGVSPPSGVYEAGVAREALSGGGCGGRQPLRG
jgi:hypothetical protein